jgi:hypothetical protein
LRGLRFERSPLLVSADGSYCRIQHILIAKRLEEEIDCASLHGLNRHRYVAISCHHNDRQANAHLSELSLEFQAVHVWEPDVNNNATAQVP